MLLCRQQPTLWTRCRNSTAGSLPTVRRRHKWAPWTPERLATSPKYPLSKELLNTVPKGVVDFQGRAKRVHLRTQIVSPDLCDDILKYIGPSLDKHKGCDILDLNPGAGLWSQKLHEFLEPRSHILLEHSDSIYGETLQPLVDKPGSTYKLLSGNLGKFETYTDVINSGAFPHQKRLSPEASGAQNPNNSLLVTGSLIWDPTLPGMGFDSMAKQLLQRFAVAAWSNDLFHAFGPVRMLLWTLRDDTMSALPQSSHKIGKSSMFLDKVSTVTEVVTPPELPRSSVGTSSGREARYTLQSLMKAMQSGRQRGMEYPAHRRRDIHEFADHVEHVSNGTGIITIPECTAYLEDQIRSGKVADSLLPESVINTFHEQQALADDPHVYSSREYGRTNKFLTEKGHLAMSHKSQTGRHNKLASQKDAIVDQAMKIYHLECKILGITSKTEKQSAMKELTKLNEEYDDAFRRRQGNIRQQILSDIDDRISLCSPVPRLRWDARPFEPLHMEMDEVWPANRACLIDVQPKPIPEGQSADSYEYFQDFVFGLFWKKTQSVPDALDTMQSGASQLIDHVPILRDPAQGGRLDLKHMRVRMLTSDMIDALCTAYREWPFRAPDANHSKYFRLKTGANYI